MNTPNKNTTDLFHDTGDDSHSRIHHLLVPVHRSNVEEAAEPADSRPTFAFIATDWLERELIHPIVVKPKAHTTLYCYQHIANDYLIPDWGKCIAEQIEPSDIEKWLAGLSVDKKGAPGLQWG